MFDGEVNRSIGQLREDNNKYTIKPMVLKTKKVLKYPGFPIIINRNSTQMLILYTLQALESD